MIPAQIFDEIHQKENEAQKKASAADAFLFMTSCGEISNFLMKDLDRILQLETIDKCEVPAILLD
ncbi:MAG: hypothetical protein HYZ42_09095 [Bacteroidetes bacterium]|nr:hypothetical protein [Bacteroidota bacterium]